MRIKGIAIIAIASTWVAAVEADSTEARCDIYPAGEDHASSMLHCAFSQRQGYITITRDDGVTHDLSPVDDTPGNFRDQQGSPVYRQSGLGDQGLIFRFPDQSIYLYWNTSALEPASSTDNWTAPFTTADYDATTRLRCRSGPDGADSSCPAGILRMENGQASVVVQSPSGEQFTINFMSDYISATNRTVTGKLEDDTWILTINGKEIYEVPLAAIEGG